VLTGVLFLAIFTVREIKLVVRMNQEITGPVPHFGRVKTAVDMGRLIRAHRKSQHLTLEKVSGLSNLGMRFLSELERGKETAELGKALEALNKLGLEVIIQPRGYKNV
jgi:HTH-type transcriptional regulator/antitoxin HipB